jgi:hypothetical protein
LHAFLDCKDKHGNLTISELIYNINTINSRKFHQEVLEYYHTYLLDNSKAITSQERHDILFKYIEKVISSTFRNMGIIPACEFGHGCKYVCSYNGPYGVTLVFECSFQHQFKKFVVI